MALRLIPFIMMDGNAKEAIQFYEKSLDAKVNFMQTFGDAPGNPQSPLPADMKERVAHAVLQIGETNIMVADTFPGQPLQRGNQVNICITTNEIEKSKKFYESLKQDGQVSMPLQETHFSPAYGILTDKFGVSFQICTFFTEEAVIRGHEKTN